MDGDLRDISFGAGSIPRVVESDDNKTVDGLEADEDALDWTTLFQGLSDEVGRGGFWNVSEEKETGGCWLGGAVEVEGEVWVGGGGGSMGG